MVLSTKVCGELSLRIQQGLPRCNNRGAFQGRAAPPERQGLPLNFARSIESRGSLPVLFVYLYGLTT